MISRRGSVGAPTLKSPVANSLSRSSRVRPKFSGSSSGGGAKGSGGVGRGHPGGPREVLRPMEVHRGGFVPPALVLVLDEPLVDAEIPVEIHRLPPRPAVGGGGGK